MELKVLQSVLQEMAAAPNLLEALRGVTRHIKTVLQTDLCGIFLSDESLGEYVLMAIEGMDAGWVGHIRLKYGQGLVGLVGEREEPINIECAVEHSHYYCPAEIQTDDYNGFLGVPLVFCADVLGVLFVQQKETRRFEENIEAFLMTLAVPLAHQVAMVRMHEGLPEFQAQRRQKSVPTLEGVPGAPGIAIGQAVLVFPSANLDLVPEKSGDDVQTELELFELAIAAAREEMRRLQSRAESTFSVAERTLFEAYVRILESPTLVNAVRDEIHRGVWAQGALKRVIKKQVLRLESSEDSYLRERASDFRDLGRRVLAQLQKHKSATPDYPPNTVLVSEEVTATLILEVPDGCLAGILSGSGSSNSHVAILAKALGVPAVMGVTGIPLIQLSGQELILDAYNGQVYVAPQAALRNEFRKLLEEEKQLNDELQALRDVPAITKDGHDLSLYLNTGWVRDGSLSLRVGADGVGLYRTEMSFMLRDRFPSEDEQRSMYRQLLTTFSPRPVLMRTLDVGGDKPLIYFPIHEDNPFLGWRGVRVTLDHPEIFLQQIRAMLRADEGLGNLGIMLPMVSSVSEVEASLCFIRQAYQELIEEKTAVSMPKIGVMIEVPAAVYQVETLAKHVDFLSVGSNDLIQYLLAVDRNNPRVSQLYNGMHPSVLRVLYQVVKSAHKSGKKISLCGELAGDPVAVLLLVAMGFDALSIQASSLLRVKYIIRHFTLARAKAVLKEVLEMDEANEIQQHMESILEESGLGGFIRAGK